MTLRDAQFAPPARQKSSHHVHPSASGVFYRPSSLVDAGVDAARRAVSAAARLGTGALRQGAHVVASPSHAASLAGAVVREVGTAGRLLLTPVTSTARTGAPRK